ncbi:MAG: cation diffusion facilitator family transporter [Micrococcales bacterium]|nr:cation diffusion facilitator family transporter [Micrococcales bacterium]
MSTAESTIDKPTRDLRKYAWLSIAAAILTIGLKAGAWAVTGSVGLLSDAAESIVNLVAAVAALIALTVAARPADDGHHFGHTKAEYFSAAIEGLMIFVAAVVIIWQAVDRFLNPRPIENVGIGLGISIVASIINGAVALVLLRAGRQHRSITLEADGKHLMTDVWTSVGVVVGVLLVAVTGIERLDPIVAAAVGINIIVAGVQLIRASGRGLMDGAMDAEENAQIAAVLERFESPEVRFHGLRTRVAGHQGFAEVHMLVPGGWTVQRSHDVAEEVEAALRETLPDLHLVTHVEPLEDPRSYDDFQAEFPVGNPPTEPLARDGA